MKAYNISDDYNKALLLAFGHKLRKASEFEKAKDYGTVIQDDLLDPMRVSDFSTLWATQFFRIVLLKRILTIAILSLFFGLSLSIRFQF